MNVNDTYARLGEYITAHESETYGEIAASLGLTRATVCRIAKLQGIKRRPGRRSAALEAAAAIIGAATAQASSATAGEAAAPLEQQPVSAPPDAPLVCEALSATPGTAPAESAVA